MSLVSTSLQSAEVSQRGSSMLLIILILIGLIFFMVSYIKKTQKVKRLEIQLAEKIKKINQLEEQLAEKENNSAFKIGTDGTIIRIDETYLDITFCPHCGKKLK
jgi:transcription initiation factor IIE alpha subunit